jgi:hypothetical protein
MAAKVNLSNSVSLHEVREQMKFKGTKILPLASALGTLAGSAVVATEAQSATPTMDPAASAPSETSKTQVTKVPNMLVSTGETLLGFVMTDQPDGTVVAQHASHASHASHYSGR